MIRSEDMENCYNEDFKVIELFLEEANKSYFGNKIKNFNVLKTFPSVKIKDGTDCILCTELFAKQDIKDTKVLGEEDILFVDKYSLSENKSIIQLDMENYLKFVNLFNEESKLFFVEK